MKLEFFLNLLEDPVDTGSVNEVSAIWLMVSEFGNVTTLPSITEIRLLLIGPLFSAWVFSKYSYSHPNMI